MDLCCINLAAIGEAEFAPLDSIKSEAACLVLMKVGSICTVVWRDVNKARVSEVGSISIVIINNYKKKMPGAFGHKFYWRSGVFGVMLGFAELSLVKNLNKV